MTGFPAPTRIYIGRRENIIAEVGGLSHIYEGKYLIQPDGDAAYDAVGADTLKDLKVLVAEFVKAYPSIEVRRVD